jgi:hypothetical protein
VEAKMLLLRRIRRCVDGHRKYHSINTSLSRALSSLQ